MTTVHVDADDLQAYLRGQLQPEHTAVVEDHLLGCEPCKDSLSRSIALNIKIGPAQRPKAKQKRSELRFSAGDQAVFQALNPLSVERCTAVIVDVSKSGIGVVVPHPVFPGTIAQVRIKNHVELGEVRHCAAVGDRGYRVGLRLNARA